MGGYPHLPWVRNSPERVVEAPAGLTPRRHHGSRTPLPLRIYRVTRATAHVVEGLATIIVIFPWITKARRQTIIRQWSGRLLRVFAIETRVQGRLHEDRRRGMVLVANHVSWLDIFVLNAVQPARFIAKAELRRWPFIGWLIAGVGTLFIERSGRRHTHQVNRHVGAALASGDVVAIFPEGATSDGLDVRSFHGSLLQPVVDVDGHVQPVAIRYRLASGAPTVVPAYVGDVSFMGSVWRITALRGMLVELMFATAVPAANRHRRDLARASETAIRAALGLGSLQDRAPEPGTPRDREA